MKNKFLIASIIIVTFIITFTLIFINRPKSKEDYSLDKNDEILVKQIRILADEKTIFFNDLNNSILINYNKKSNYVSNNLLKKENIIKVLLDTKKIIICEYGEYNNSICPQNKILKVVYGSDKINKMNELISNFNIWDGLITLEQVNYDYTLQMIDENGNKLMEIYAIPILSINIENHKYYLHLNDFDYNILKEMIESF